MKLRKLLFGIAFAFFAFSVNAQFTFESQEGEVFEDGDTYLTNSLIFDEASLDYRIVNTTSETLFMKVEIVNINGNDGNDFEFCFGLCYFGINVGNEYPANAPLEIAANGDTGPGNHIWYGGPDVDPEIVVELEARYYQTTEDGETQIGDDFTFFYKYDPDALNVNELQENIGISINSTVMQNELRFNSTNTGTVSLYDINGRLVTSSTFGLGTQSIDVSSLKSQLYIATFTTEEGATQSLKLIKK